MKTFAQFKRESFKDKALKQAYDDLGPEFAVRRLIIERRLKQGLTQAALAKKVGTKQPAIARLESGKYNPSLAFLYKVARALDAELIVTVRS